MPHAVTDPRPPFPICGGAAEVHQLPAAQDNLMWVLLCRATRQAAVVDGPPEIDALLALLTRLDATLAAVWNTHTHHDHIGVNRALADRGLLEGIEVVGPAGAAADVPGLTTPVDEGDRVRLGGVEAQVWRTDGHLDGHVCFVLDGAVFCGDTLFAGGCGYLFDGPPAAMYRSLLRLASLPGDTAVCCAHEYTLDNLAFARFVEPGNDALERRSVDVTALRAAGGCAVPSTIEDERATNPFLRPGSPALLARLRELGMPCASPLEAFTSARALKDRKAHRA